MKPALDDIFLPYGWTAVSARDDGIAFTRDEDRITLVAEPTDESPSMPGLCANQLWQIRCEQRVGEAESGTPLCCVTTMDTAVETLLTYMRRINDAAESEGGISVGAMVELLRTESAVADDEWGRTPSNHTDALPPSP